MAGVSRLGGEDARVAHMIKLVLVVQTDVVRVFRWAVCRAWRGLGLVLALLAFEQVRRNVDGCGEGVGLGREVADDEEAAGVVSEDLAILVHDDHRLDARVVILAIRDGRVMCAARAAAGGYLRRFYFRIKGGLWSWCRCGG